MSKHARNTGPARERTARHRTGETGRRRRQSPLLAIAAAAVAAAAAAGVTLSGGGAAAGRSPAPRLRLAALSTRGTPKAAAAPSGRLGQHGDPIPDGPLLAGNATMAMGQPVDGIWCESHSRTRFHIHVHLTVFVNGVARRIPAGIGIIKARAELTPWGYFPVGGHCRYWLHTHAANGVIHIETPFQHTYTLGDFFDEWGQPLGWYQVGPALGSVTAYDNGRLYWGNPRDIPLTSEAHIELDVAGP